MQLAKEILEMVASSQSTCFDRLMGIGLLLLMLLAVVIVVALIFNLVDTIGIVPKHVIQTAIKHRRIIPAYTTHQEVKLGDKTIPITNHFPERYILQFDIEGSSVDFDVEPSTYTLLRVGDLLEVRYGYGRITRLPVPHSIRPAGDAPVTACAG